MVQVKRFGLMALVIKATTGKVKSTEKECMSGLTGQLMMEIGLTIE